MGTIKVLSIYGHDTRQPYVQVVIGDRKPIELCPDDARSLALNLLSAAEAAEQDAFMVEFGQASLGLDLQHAALFLRRFREWRESRPATEPPSTHNTTP